MDGWMDKASRPQRPLYKRTRCSFLLSVSAFLTNSLLSFHVILFFSVLLLFLLPYAMGRPESCMLSVNRICLLHGDLKSFSIFT
jgi:hypothetical protein